MDDDDDDDDDDDANDDDDDDDGDAVVDDDGHGYHDHHDGSCPGASCSKKQRDRTAFASVAVPECPESISLGL